MIETGVFVSHTGGTWISPVTFPFAGLASLARAPGSQPVGLGLHHPLLPHSFQQMLDPVMDGDMMPNVDGKPVVVMRKLRLVRGSRGRAA